MPNDLRTIRYAPNQLLLITFTTIAHAQPQRTKIAILGLVHSHCWGFVTKLNTMHQNQDLIEVVGVSDDNQELRDYIKTLMPGTPMYDNHFRAAKPLKIRFRFTTCTRRCCICWGWITRS